MSPVSGTLLQRYNPKHVLLVSLVAKMLFTFAFVVSVNPAMLIVSRCLTGFAQSKNHFTQGDARVARERRKEDRTGEGRGGKKKYFSQSKNHLTQGDARVAKERRKEDRTEEGRGVKRRTWKDKSRKGSQHGLLLFLFYCSSMYFWVIFSHFSVGTVVVFSPVWVDRYGDDKKRTLWMGCMQGEGCKSCACYRACLCGSAADCPPFTFCCYLLHVY